MSGTSVNTLQKNRKTPGVYVTEFTAFPPSIVGVATAVPCFIGYTETAKDPSSNKQLYMQPIEISSMADYYSYFGYGYDTQYIVRQMITDQKDTTKNDTDYDFQAYVSDGATTPNLTLNRYLVTGGDNNAVIAKFNLFAAMRLFFDNGGGTCYVVSVANYWGTTDVKPTPEAKATVIDADKLVSGIDAAGQITGPTMTVVPDACLIPPTVTQDKDKKDVVTYPGYQKVVNAMMKQASDLQDRVAILDMQTCMDPSSWNVTRLEADAKVFYGLIAPSSDYFSYGVTYAPAVETSILSTADLNYENLQASDDSTNLVNLLLTTQALQLYGMGSGGTENAKYKDVCAHIGAAYVYKAAPPADDTEDAAADDTKVPAGYSAVDPTICAIPKTDQDKLSLENYLKNAVPLQKQIEQILADKLNVAPPSGLMAGIWTKNDSIRGVWNAPANYSLLSVIGPKIDMTNDQQGDFNVPLNGNAIDILRAFPGRGTVVWGARTLDGNSDDWRYVQVRRTLVYIEQSIKQALQSFVFAANTGATWTTVTGMITTFLTDLWRAGGLMGDKASEAFSVQCGLGSTMTGQDILNGYMIVNVQVQLIHPAEFIELTFTQTMQGV